MRADDGPSKPPEACEDLIQDNGKAACSAGVGDKELPHWVDHPHPTSTLQEQKGI